MTSDEMKKKRAPSTPVPEKRYGNQGAGHDYQAATVTNMTTAAHSFKELGYHGASVETNPDWAKSKQVKPVPFPEKE